MDVFSNCEDIDCPVCEGETGEKITLNCAAQNYSGCGVDIGVCNNCGSSFQISFKVDKVRQLNASQH